MDWINQNWIPDYLLEIKLVCIVYVDHLIFWGKYEKDIHDPAIKFHEYGVNLEEHDYDAGCLWVTLERNNKTVLVDICQDGLIIGFLEH